MSTAQASPGRVTRADRLREATTHYPQEVRDAPRWVAYLGADPTVLPESRMELADDASLADPSTWTDLAGAIDAANRNRSAHGVAFVCGGGWVQARLKNPTSADITLGVMNEQCSDGTTDLRVLMQHPVEDDEVNPRWPDETRLTTIRHQLWAVPVPLRLVGQVEAITAGELRDLVQLDPTWLDIARRNDHAAAARLMFTTALTESDGSKADRAYFIDTVQQAMQLAGIDPPTKRALDGLYTAAKSSLPTRANQPSKARKRAERAEQQDGFIDDLDHANAMRREIEAHGDRYLAAENLWLLRDNRTGLLTRATSEGAAGLYGYAEDWVTRHMDQLDLGRLSVLTYAHRLAYAVTHTQSLHITIDSLDSEPELVGTPDGVMDLRTGQVRKATNAEQITMSLPFSPAATYEGSVWIDWLQKVVPDPTERTLLQNLMGYTLCGHRDGKLFVVLHGTSGAGKSAFLEVMIRVMGMYGGVLNARYLYASEQGEASLDYAFAQLHGKRFAIADELQPGRTIAEDLIKSLSTGATVITRKRHGHEQAAVATACLWMGTNDLPRVRGGGESMVVRCRLLEWHHVLNQHDIRTHLYADLPAVLAWVVEGARRYLTEGPPCLAQTPAMLDAATEWLTEEAYSPMRRFVKDCIGHEAEAWTSTADMEEAYYEWCKRQRDRIDAKWNATGLASALDGYGFRKTGPAAQYPCPAYTGRKRDSSGKLARGWFNLVLREPTARPVQPLTSGKPAAWNPDWIPTGFPF